MTDILSTSFYLNETWFILLCLISGQISGHGWPLIDIGYDFDFNIDLITTQKV